MIEERKGILERGIKIVLSVGEDEIESLRFSALKKADILEIRIDHFKEPEEERIIGFIKRIKKRRNIPVIATIRMKSEGGKRYIAPSVRLRLFKAVMVYVEAVDIEMHSRILNPVIELAKQRDKITILSYHNLNSTPPVERLEEIIRSGFKRGGDIVKLAAFARRKADVLRLLNVLFKHRDKNIVVLSLGEIGKISRFFFPFFGSLFTYTCLKRPFAPAQINLSQMYEVLNKLDLKQIDKC
ncbi:MAG: type I 3-dehydroquinate dehydratase [Candidatus Omnitrophota bacterium]|nr:MAG: type I 3-dehydroquinate dehydratase [Candidatus Omnitrophota bacterium]